MAQKRIQIDNFEVGDSVEISKLISQKIVNSLHWFNFNHIHVDSEYAAKSDKKPIIPGMCLSLFSGLFGTKLPGEGGYKSQNINLKTICWR